MIKNKISRKIVRSARECIGNILWSGCVDRIIRKNTLTVLMLHRVIPTGVTTIGDKNLCISAKKLENCIGNLTKKLTAYDLYNRPLNLNKRGLSITFDDGWQDNYSFAKQYLIKNGIPFTIFLTAGLIDTNKNLWFHSLDLLFNAIELEKIVEFFKETFSCTMKIESSTDVVYELKKYPFQTINNFICDVEKKFKINLQESSIRTLLNWDEVSELADAGATFGSHGMKHAIMSLLNTTEMVDEAKESWNVLTKKVKTFIPVYSFPNGTYSRENVEICKKYGYKFGLSANLQMQQYDEHFKIIPRISISEDLSINLIKYKICISHLKKKWVC